MFKRKATQVIKFEQNVSNASLEDNSILFVKVSNVVTTSNAQFEVPLTHNAFLVKGGGDCRFYKSGTYPVFDNKEEIKQWKNGVSVDVIYMPKNTNVTVLWGTPDKVEYRDSVSGEVIQVGARGQFGISIINPEQFLHKVVGANTRFDLSKFQEHFAAAVVYEFADCFLTIVESQKFTYDKFDAKKKEISIKMQELLSEKFAESWGISLVDFMIIQFNISQEDKEKIASAASKYMEEQEAIKKENKYKEYLAELERLDDKQWEREKYLRNLEKEDKIAYYEVLKAIGEESLNKAKGDKYCPKCGHSCKKDDVFCSSCGEKFTKSPIVCSYCKKENASDATFCSSCGRKIK